MEISGHPFFIGSQYHPQLKNTVENPHPLFVAFIKAAKEAQEQRNGFAKRPFETSTVN